MIDDETFFAWLDGEPSPDQAAAVEREVAADPRLSALTGEHRAMQAELKGAFAEVADAPLPGRLRDMVQPRPAEVVDFGIVRRRRGWRIWRSPPQWSAMAAMLVVGILVGTMMQPRSGSPVQVRNGRIYPSSGLKQALDVQLASLPSNGAVRIGLTFRDRSGAICRTFTDPQASGLACHDRTGWQLRGLFTVPEGQGHDYRMAGGMDPNLAALVESTMPGEPFGAAQEKAARKEGWN